MKKEENAFWYQIYIKLQELNNKIEAHITNKNK